MELLTCNALHLYHYLNIYLKVCWKDLYSSLNIFNSAQWRLSWKNVNSSLAFICLIHILTPRIRDSSCCCSCSCSVTEKSTANTLSNGYYYCVKHTIQRLTHYPITNAWVTRPERPKGAKDEVKRPEGPPARSRGPEGPWTSSTAIKTRKETVYFCHRDTYRTYPDSLPQHNRWTHPCHIQRDNIVFHDLLHEQRWPCTCTLRPHPPHQLEFLQI